MEILDEVLGGLVSEISDETPNTSQCNVCFDMLDLNELWCELPCSHEYCMPCLQSWARALGTRYIDEINILHFEIV